MEHEPREENDTEPVLDHGSKDHPEVQHASELEKADIELGEKLARHRDEPAVKAAGAATKIGDQGPLYAITAALFVAGVLARDRRLTGSSIAMLAGVALSDLAKSGIKRSVSRTRPNVLMDEQRYEKEAHGSPQKQEQSFPSGHTACSVAAARALSRNFPKAGAAAGVAAVAIGITRVAKGAHWPLDVLGGAIIGLVAESITTSLLRVGFDEAKTLGAPEWLPILTANR